MYFGCHRTLATRNLYQRQIDGNHHCSLSIDQVTPLAMKRQNQKAAKYDTCPNKKTRYVYVIEEEEEEEEYVPTSPFNSPLRFDPESEEGEVYSPRSPPHYSYEPASTPSQYDPDLSDVEKDDIPVLIPEKFFDSGKVPFHFDKSHDGYCLDSDCIESSITEELLEETNAEKALFCRNIQSFRAGDVVTKHIAPWGENAILCGPDYIIQKKIFGANGKVVFVLVKPAVAVAESDLIALVPAFFNGWMDTPTLIGYLKCSKNAF